MALQAINPTTGEAFATYQELSAEAVQGIIADTHQPISGGGRPTSALTPCASRLRFDLSHAPWQTRRGWWRNVTSRPDRPTHTHDGRP